MSNDFIPFAVGGSANVITQSAYAGLTSLTQNGFQSGIAQSNQLNKVWRQSSIMAAVLAQFIVDQSGQNAVDDGTTATLEANLIAAIKNATKQTVILSDTGVANAYTATNTPALTALPSTGYVQRINIAHANTGASTYAPDGLTAKPIYGLGLQPLQGGELPVGVAVLMYLVQAGVNSGNGAWIIIESLGGASQVAPATQSQHAAQLGQLAAAVGSIVNGAVNLTAASNSLTFTADQVIVGSALNGLVYAVPSVNLTINTSTVGANGMNTGSPAVSGFVAVYLLFNPTTGAKALLGVNEVSINIPPMVFAGTGIPAGYTANCLIGSYWTNASGQFVSCMQAGRRIWNTGAATISGAGVATLAGTVWPAVPNAAKSVSGNINITNSGSSADAVTLFPLSTGGPGYKNHNRNGAVGGSAACFSDLPINPSTPRTSYYTIQATGGSINVSITSTDYVV